MQKKSKLNVFTFMMLIILSLTFQSAISIYAACPEEISSYWKLDETTPGTYEDFIKDNDGTGNANPTVTADGIVNGAQTFDGTTTGIDVEPDRSLNWTVDESFSIEFWVKRDGDVTGENQVAIGRVDSGSSLVWWVGIGDDTDPDTDQNMAAFVLQDSDGDDLVTVTGTKDITDNVWHHVVAVRDSTANEILLYVDGETPASASTSYDAGFDSATADINIGYLDVATLFQLAGGLDEIALYDRALTSDEIEDHYAAGQPTQDYCSGSDPFVPYPDNTISLWDLDETTPGTYEDAFNGYDGTGNVNPTATADGIVNGAQTFDGTTTGIDVPAYKSFNWAVDESFSIEFWVKRDGDVTGENQVAIGRVDSGSSLVWWVGIGDDTDPDTDQNMAAFVLQDSDGDDLVTVTGTKDITDNVWHHVVAVRDSTANEILLYVDGETPASASTSYDAGFDSATADINIGYLDVATLFQLAGGLDEIALYDRALTSDEIEDHYEDGLLGNGIEDTGGIAEIIGTWSSGIWYRDVAESRWTKMTSFTTTGDIAAGDFTGDGIADVASIWPGSLWYQDGATLAWTEIPVNTPGGVPNGVTAGDVTGDGRFEIIGTWSSGIWYRDVAESIWFRMTPFTTAGDIAAGDFTGDGIADVASIWPGSLWYQDGATLAWTEIPVNTPGGVPNGVTAGDVTGDGRFEIIGTWSSGIWYRDVAASSWTQMTSFTTTGDIAAGDFTGDGIADVASIWPGSLWYQDGATLDWTEIPGPAPNRVTAGDVTGQ